MILVDNLYLFFGSNNILNVSELRKRYHSFSKLMHPDVLNNNDAFIKSHFTNITSVYNLLLNKNFKKYYDKIILNQKDSIEYIDSTKISYLDLVDCTYISESDKLNLGVIELSNDFSIKKLEVLISFFLKSSPNYPIRFLKKIIGITNSNFYEIYYDLLFEILLNYHSLFGKYIEHFMSLDLNEKDRSILLLCEKFNNNSLKIKELKDLMLIYDNKILHLLSIKMI
jgi:hypothetical protein